MYPKNWTKYVRVMTGSWSPEGEKGSCHEKPTALFSRIETVYHRRAFEPNRHSPRMALSQRDPAQGYIHHSDQGVQSRYSMGDWNEELRKKNS